MKTNCLDIRIKGSVEEAPLYKTEEGWKVTRLDHFVIVRKGTEDGRSTVDIVFHDQEGNKFVTMITGRLMRALAAAIGDEG